LNKKTAGMIFSPRLFALNPQLHLHHHVADRVAPIAVARAAANRTRLREHTRRVQPPPFLVRTSYDLALVTGCIRRINCVVIPLSRPTMTGASSAGGARLVLLASKPDDKRQIFQKSENNFCGREIACEGPASGVKTPLLNDESNNKCKTETKKQSAASAAVTRNW
jgi:hypothetical protein